VERQHPVKDRAIIMSTAYYHQIYSPVEEGGKLTCDLHHRDVPSLSRVLNERISSPRFGGSTLNTAKRRSQITIRGRMLMASSATLRFAATYGAQLVKCPLPEVTRRVSCWLNQFTRTVLLSAKLHIRSIEPRP
jgi:hypothetical protein